MSRTPRRVVSKQVADKLLRNGEAVLVGSPAYWSKMRQQWERLAKKYVYIRSANRWMYVEKGLDKGFVDTNAAQSDVSAHYSIGDVLTWGPKKESATVRSAWPELAMHGDPKYRANVGEDVMSEISADWCDTFPGVRERIVKDGEHTAFNLWTPPNILPCKPEKYQEPRWFLDVVDYVFGTEPELRAKVPDIEWNERLKARDYFLDWCAHLVQRPDVRMPVSVLIASKATGIGKSFLAVTLKHMVGPRTVRELTADALKNSFHNHIPGTTLAVIHELYENGNYSFIDRLKTWQTEDYQQVNIKYGPSQGMRVCLHFLCFSNREAPITLDGEDRRWFTYASPVKEAEKKPAEWWNDKWACIKDANNKGLPHKGKLGALMRWLLERDLSQFQPHAAPPMTESKREIIEVSRSWFYHDIRRLLETGQLPIKKDGLVSLSDLGEETQTKGQARQIGNAQKSEDLLALGFERVRTSQRRGWRPPVGHQHARCEAF
jgi:hypothetical protein